MDTGGSIQSPSTHHHLWASKPITPQPQHPPHKQSLGLRQEPPEDRPPPPARSPCGVQDPSRTTQGWPLHCPISLLAAMYPIAYALSVGTPIVTCVSSTKKSIDAALRAHECDPKPGRFRQFVAHLPICLLFWSQSVKQHSECQCKTASAQTLLKPPDQKKSPDLLP